MRHEKSKVDRPGRDRRKMCYCLPTCRKILGLKQRRRHYKTVAANGLVGRIRASESIASSDADVQTLMPDDGDGTNTPGRMSDNDDRSSESSSHTEPSVTQNDEFGHWDWVEDSESDGELWNTEGLMDALEDVEEVKFEGELYDIRNNILSDNDRDNIRAFNLLLRGKITQTAFKQMRFAFRHKIDLDSDYVIFNRITRLAGVATVKYDCCPQSCILYAGKYSRLPTCPYCKQPRFRANGKPRRRFVYFPLVPRLKGFFQSVLMMRLMDYRASYEPTRSSMSDVFDGAHYRKLVDEYVEVDGETLTHRYFCDRRDIAFALSTDSYLLYKSKRGGPTATPILLVNYNIPPDQRTRHEHLICVGIIPGPRQPKEVASFLSPLDDELAELAYGVPTFDAEKGVMFDLHAYIIFKLGDILAIQKFLDIKGHNSLSPCRSCKILAVRGLGKTHYVALQPPKTSRTYEVWDSKNLPMRTHQEFMFAASKINEAPSKAAKLRIAKKTGIRGLPGLRRVGSLDYARSAPWEWFHLFLENVIPNLVDLWTGQFKGLESPADEFRIATSVWDEIAQETMAAVEHIPAAFVRVLGNIATNRSQFTAESWGFWFVYLAPILLQNRFPKQKYYVHACELGELMKLMLQFCISNEEVDNIEIRLRRWVEKYEKYYYQYRIERLPACTLTIHGLLHVAEGIRFCGPVWTTWSFFMERYCGTLQRLIRSRCQPWSHLNNVLLHSVALEQLSLRYNLSAELALWDDRGDDGPVGFERVFEDYPDHVIRPPFKRVTQEDPSLQQKIARYVAQVIGKRESEVKKRLPLPTLFAGKLRIRGGGDFFRTTTSSRRSATPERRNCYVKYEVTLETRKHRLIHVTGYGDLNKIFVLTLATDGFFAALSGRTLVLALVTPWNTEGKDAAVENTYLLSRRATIITDIRSLKAVVGLVPVGKRWGIIDRTTATATQGFGDTGISGDTHAESDSDVDEPLYI